MASDNHDTLVFRLAQILVKLNQGDKLDPQALADEFGVNLRTIQRDLNVRFAYLPLEKTDGRYHLDPAFLGKLTTKDIERFAGLAGVRGLFPSLSDDFLRDVFDTRVQAALLVKGLQQAGWQRARLQTRLLRVQASIENTVVWRRQRTDRPGDDSRLIRSSAGLSKQDRPHVYGSAWLHVVHRAEWRAGCSGTFDCLLCVATEGSCCDAWGKDLLSARHGSYRRDAG